MQAYSVFAETIMVLRRTLARMQPALGLGKSAPAARAFVLAQHDRPRARPAADARIALIVERVVGNVVLRNQTPHFLLRPIRERADFYQLKLLVPAHDGRLRAVGALIAANRARPRMHAQDGLVQHFDLPIEAALVGIRFIERAA